MTGPTHRQYSVLFACLTLMLFYSFNVIDIEYYVMIPTVLAISKAGALFPDVDHDWHNVHDKTVTNKIINIIIHATGGKHRSWQTHSIDICLWFTLISYIAPVVLRDNGIINQASYGVLSLTLLSFASGWISHLFADMMTSAGVRIFCFWKFKPRLVPKKLGNFRFNTGHEWEKFNYTAVKILNIPLGIIVLIYPFIIDGTIPNFIKAIINY